MPLAFFYNKIDKLKKIRDMRAEIREQDENAIYLGIFATDEDKLIGFIALHSFNYINKKLKIGYVLNKKYNTLKDLQNQEQKLQTQYEKELQLSEELKDQEEYVKTDDYVEEMARNLGLLYPNEVIYKPEE